MAVYRDREGSVVLLVDAAGRIAMQLRDDKPGLPGANKWGLFGGLRDRDESPHAVALREIREELGVELDPDRLTLYREHTIPAQNLTTWVFHYRVTNELDAAVLREGQMWDFIGPGDARAADIGLHHREIVLGYWANAVP